MAAMCNLLSLLWLL